LRDAENHNPACYFAINAKTRQEGKGGMADTASMQQNVSELASARYRRAHLVRPGH
jgi:hypothetical protein